MFRYMFAALPLFAIGLLLAEADAGPPLKGRMAELMRNASRCLSLSV
jgi:hypothetical protein